MADILHQIPIQASPQEVYEALTREQKLKSWWTDDVSTDAMEGGIAEFRFEAGRVVFRMRVDRLSPGQEVAWSLMDPAPPEWGGTRVTWELTPADGGTSLLFGHRNWASTDGSFAAINYNWAYYLTSLKAYLEQGKGTPHLNEG
jgi:uncharacterized protein YndB with AHSA1/START domain